MTKSTYKLFNTEQFYGIYLNFICVLFDQTRRTNLSNTNNNSSESEITQNKTLVQNEFVKPEVRRKAEITQLPHFPPDVRD